MREREEIGFEVYKGLQRPLVFKTFKGKFIYWMAGGLLASFLLCVLLSTLAGYLLGGLSLGLGAFATLTFVNKKQKQGIHSKSKVKGVVHIKPQFKQKIIE